MLYMQEFEIREAEEGDGWYVAFPFDLGGGTQGNGFEDAVSMAADWLPSEA